jgi:hypothetical protein
MEVTPACAYLQGTMRGRENVREGEGGEGIILELCVLPSTPMSPLYIGEGEVRPAWGGVGVATKVGRSAPNPNPSRPTPWPMGGGRLAT